MRTGRRARDGPEWWMASVAAGALTAFTAFFAQPGAAASSSTPSLSHPSGVEVPHAKILFTYLDMVSAKTGWGLDQKGQLWRTASGGVRWLNVMPRDLPPPAAATEPLIPVFLAGSADTAWVIDTRDEITYRTTDGGVQWQRGSRIRLAITNDGGTDMSFINKNSGWLMVSSGGHDQVGELFFTNDGGMQWIRVARTGSGQPGALPSGGAISFSPTVRGLGWLYSTALPGPSPVLYVTRDGGQRWRPASFPMPGGHNGRPSAGSRHAFVGLPVFPSAGNGVVTATLSSAAYGHNQAVYFTTADGGLHWKPSKPLGVGSTLGTMMSWVNAKMGWVYVADTNTFYRTVDGGQTWSAIHPNVAFQKLPLDWFGFAPGGRTGWATVAGGALTFTHNGGRTWR